MMILAAIEHRIRTFLAAIDCGLIERARGFDSHEAGDYLMSAAAISREVDDAREMRAERARQALVEREEEEEVAEPTFSCLATLEGCPCVEDIGGWHVCVHGARFTSLYSDYTSAHAGADPASVAPPAAEARPAADCDIPPSPAAGLPLSDLMAELKDAVGDHYDNGKAVDSSILWDESGIGEAIDWRGVARTLLIYFDIQRRPLSAAARDADTRMAKRIRDTGIESGLDMGASMASEFFPQHTKRQK